MRKIHTCLLLICLGTLASAQTGPDGMDDGSAELRIQATNASEEIVPLLHKILSQIGAILSREGIAPKSNDEAFDTIRIESANRQRENTGKRINLKRTDGLWENIFVLHYEGSPASKIQFYLRRAKLHSSDYIDPYVEVDAAILGSEEVPTLVAFSLLDRHDLLNDTEKEAFRNLVKDLDDRARSLRDDYSRRYGRWGADYNRMSFIPLVNAIRYKEPWSIAVGAASVLGIGAMGVLSANRFSNAESYAASRRGASTEAEADFYGNAETKEIQEAVVFALGAVGFYALGVAESFARKSSRAGARTLTVLPQYTSPRNGMPGSVGAQFIYRF